jgi:hypothetical protein
MRAGAFPGTVSEELIGKRLCGQEILTRTSSPPFFWAVLDQAVIRRPVGGAAVMRDQLQHLIAMSELPHVSIQVVLESGGWYHGMDGAIVLLRKPDEAAIRSVGYVEGQLGGRLMEDAAEVANLEIRFDQIRGKALSENDSLTLIKKATKTMTAEHPGP